MTETKTPFCLVRRAKQDLRRVVSSFKSRRTLRLTYFLLKKICFSSAISQLFQGFSLLWSRDKGRERGGCRAEKDLRGSRKRPRLRVNITVNVQTPPSRRPESPNPVLTVTGFSRDVSHSMSYSVSEKREPQSGVTTNIQQFYLFVNTTTPYLDSTSGSEVSGHYFSTTLVGPSSSTPPCRNPTGPKLRREETADRVTRTHPWNLDDLESKWQTFCPV